MMNKYKIIDKFKYKDKLGYNKVLNISLVVLEDNLNNNYFCLIRKDENNDYEEIIYVSEKANRFDIIKTLFDTDIDIYKVLPKEYISEEIDNIYNNYYPGKAGKCIYKTSEEYKKAYIKENNRISKF